MACDSVPHMTIRPGADFIRGEVRVYLPVSGPAGDTAWMEQGACRGHDPAMWDTSRRQNKMTTVTAANLRAIAICEGCPVTGECLRHGEGQRWGIYGGLLPEQRDGRA